MIDKNNNRNNSNSVSISHHGYVSDIENWEFRLNGKNLADKEFVATTQGGRSYYGERRTVVLTARTQF